MMVLFFFSRVRFFLFARDCFFKVFLFSKRKSGFVYFERSLVLFRVNEVLLIVFKEFFVQRGCFFFRERFICVSEFFFQKKKKTQGLIFSNGFQFYFSTQSLSF